MLHYPQSTGIVPIMQSVIPKAKRPDLMYQIESRLGLSAKGLATLTIQRACKQLVTLAKGDPTGESLGLARKIAKWTHMAGAPATTLLFPSQKGGGPLGRVALWNILSTAKKARHVQGKGLFRFLQRLAAGLGVQVAVESILTLCRGGAKKSPTTPTVIEEEDQDYSEGDHDYSYD